MAKRLNDVVLRFQVKGFMPYEIPELVKDILGIIGNRGHCTISSIEQELEGLGWGLGILDYATFELITSLVEGNVS